MRKQRQLTPLVATRRQRRAPPLLAPGLAALSGAALLAGMLLAPQSAEARKRRPWKYIPTNRVFDVLEEPEPALDPEASPDHRQRELMRQAGNKMKRWAVYIDAVKLDRKTLVKLSRRKPTEPFTRVVRESLRRPVDVEDLIYFLDDVLNSGKFGLRRQTPWVTASRARKAGIFLHPDDVFFGKPHVYGEEEQRLNIDRPKPHQQIEEAEDGDMLGPGWWARYKNPRGRTAKLARLAEEQQTDTFTARLTSLIEQLEAQGTGVLLESTVRDQRRGYLMWGAFLLSRQKSEKALYRQVERLEEKNHEWQLDVPIVWRHPDGWRATVEAARSMADAYQVVYATEKGARESSHYDGEAFDVTTYCLPRRLKLKAPDGAREVFDLSDAEQPRDLNLTPEVVEWIEEHFQLKKMKSDYPHWYDDAPKPEPEDAGAGTDGPDA